jgi:hypothetical protein
VGLCEGGEQRVVDGLIVGLVVLAGERRELDFGERELIEEDGPEVSRNVLFFSFLPRMWSRM